MEQILGNKYLLAITCYNCAPQIERVLGKIPDELMSCLEEIMIIDNRSTDDLAGRVLEYKKETGNDLIHLYRNAENYSLGGSHKVAFLRGEDLGVSHVIILHGDDQADARDIPAMLERIESGEASTVLGSRFNKESILEGYDKKRIFGNRVLNHIYSALTLHHVEDLGSGLNIFALSDLDKKRYLNFADKMTFNIELLLDLIDRNIRYAYFPIVWREEDQVSNARNFNIAWVAFKNLMNWRLRRSAFFGNAKEGRNYQTEEVLTCD